jgi:uncharacterized protein (TIGR02996 family)
MQDDLDFLRAVKAKPDDDGLRLIYADWLDERDDPRGQFLRLHLALKTLSPDHLHRVPGEHELSYLRKQIDKTWLESVIDLS